mgnify:CR=1 FL=1
MIVLEWEFSLHQSQYKNLQLTISCHLQVEFNSMFEYLFLLISVQKQNPDKKTEMKVEGIALC